eukprot:2484286-Prorocentrum_lima.AAC.1
MEEASAVLEGSLAAIVRAGASRHVVASALSAGLRVVLTLSGPEQDSEVARRLALVKPALQQQLQRTKIGAMRLAPIACGAQRKRRNAALHAAAISHVADGGLCGGGNRPGKQGPPKEAFLQATQPMAGEAFVTARGGPLSQACQEHELANGNFERTHAGSAKEDIDELADEQPVLG